MLAHVGTASRLLFLYQPSTFFGGGGSTEKVRRLWWGASLCPPELNDMALAECVICEMRIAAWKEMVGKTELKQPTLETIIENMG